MFLSNDLEYLSYILISWLNTNLPLFFSIDLDHFGRCRWSINSGESSLFLKYDMNKLNILDAEKKTLVFKNPILTENAGGNYNL